MREDSATLVNFAVLRAGGVLLVFDGCLYIYPRQVFDRHPELKPRVARFNRELCYKLASLAL